MFSMCLSIPTPSSVYTALTTAAQQCNQLIVHERARTKAGKFGLTRQWGPEPIISALALSWGLMACDRLFLTDSVTNFSIPDGDFWTFSSCHTAESHDPIDQSGFDDNPFNKWSFQASRQDIISKFNKGTATRALDNHDPLVVFFYQFWFPCEVLVSIVFICCSINWKIFSCPHQIYHIFTT